MKRESCPSFQVSGPDAFDQAELVNELTPECHLSPTTKYGCENWCTAWSPDNSVFAWSKGRRMVQLVPWDVDRAARDEDPESIYHQTVMFDCGELVCRFGIAYFRDEDPESIYHQMVTIDCGELVWSVAFGSGKLCHFDCKISKQKFSKKLVLATGLQSGRIKLWDCSTGSVLTELLDHKDMVYDLSFSPTGPLHLVSGSRDGAVKFWDLTQDGNMYRTLRPHCNKVHGVRWSPNGKMVACVGNKKMVQVFYLDTEGSSRRMEGHLHEVVSCDFSPDSALLATAACDTRIIIWDVHTGDAVREFGHLFPPPRPIYAGGANDHFVRKVSFNSAGFLLSSVCDDGYLRVWNLAVEDEPIAIAEVNNPLCCTFAPHSSIIAVGSRSGSVGFHRSPQCVPSLHHACRLVIRSRLSSPMVDRLHLPLYLKEYLKYHFLGPCD